MNETQELKTAVRQFWGTRPCGVSHSPDPPTTPQFFKTTANHRLDIHIDWDKPFLLDAIGFQNYTGKKVLEVGCGIGVDALQWRKSGNSVVGLDYNLPSVKITRDRFANECAPGSFLNGDAERLPFRNGAFDLIYSFGVLHHTPRTDESIQEIYRCLKPGGQAIVMLYYKWSALLVGDVVMGHGLMHGKLWKSRGLGDLISRYTEWDSQTRTNINPLTKVYSKREARKMFRQFSSTEMELHYLWPGHFGPLHRLVRLAPMKIKRNLHRLFGWNLIIRAVK